MQVYKNNSIYVLYILYILFLLCVPFLRFHISDYNYYVEMFIFFLLNLLFFLKLVLLPSQLFLLLFLTPIYFLTDSNILYFFSDFICFSVLINLLNLSQSSMYITHKQSNILIFLILFYVFLNFIFTLFPQNYGGVSNRFIGLYQSTNISGSILLMFGIFFFEYYKKSKYKNAMFLLLLVIVASVLFLNKTRTTLLILPYLIFCIIKYFRKNIFILLLILLIVVAIDNLQYFTETVRLEEDDSSRTRFFLSEYAMSLISSGHYITPHGFHALNNKLTDYLLTENFPVHNDLLRYWYDWGIFGIVFFCYLSRKLYKLACKNRDIKWNLFFIYLFMLSFCFHNMFFLFHGWIILNMIIVFNNINNLKGNEYQISFRQNILR